jgi:phosphate-selective porin OprO and OprP
LRNYSSGAVHRMCAVAALCALAARLPTASAQESAAPNIAPLPSPAPNPATTTPPADALLERLRKMEERLDRVTKQNEQLARENQLLAGQVQDLSRRIGGADGITSSVIAGAGLPPGTLGGGSAAGGGDPTRTGPAQAVGIRQRGRVPLTAGGADGATSSGLAGAGLPPGTAGGGSAAGGGDPTNTGTAQVVGNRHRGRIPLLGGSYDFDNDGFRWGTEDNEITFGVRALQQLDARIYPNNNQEFAPGGFYNPRTRFYFTGNLTRPIQYEFSFQETYSTPDLLDSYINYRFSDGLQLRLGRYKTPFTYEFYRVHIWHLLTPERSLFATNYEGNRRFGFMGWGSAFDNRLEWAVGPFNGQRNGYIPYGSHQDIMAFVNFKPFDPQEGFFLQNLQFGGSVDAGIENNPLSPAVLTTSAPVSPSTLGPGTGAVPFLAFSNGVRERGDRALWELHMAYYYGGLSFLGAWDSGFESYAFGSSGPAPVRVPIHGYFVQAGYILTGETIRDRTLIDPLRPFDLRPGHFGWGAWEVTTRFSQLQLGQQVFTAGFADPNLWTNRVQMVDVGLNWYLNKFVKVYMDWEHAMFGNPVIYNTGRYQKKNDLYWLRFQVLF